MGALLSLTVFALGAVLFPMLVVAYWRESRRRERQEGEWGILGFSLAGTAAYLLNLGQWSGWMEAAWAGPALRTVTSLMAGLVVALAGGSWKSVAAVAGYGWGVQALEAPEAWESAVWALAPALSLPHAWRLRGAHRVWILGACSVMMTGAVVWIWQGGAWWRVLPDYGMLVLFGATLYYRERLVFFDVVLKQGALVAVTMPLLLLLAREAGNAALWAAPVVIAAPWVARLLSRAVDRLGLGRRHSIAEAEWIFLDALQPAANEDDLLRRAAAAAERIFRAPAQVFAEPGAARIELGRRETGVPILSDDRKLLLSLERTLGVFLENVRFREKQKQQEEQEQHLRLLASRAELKALRAQINPHFLFNALNSIAGLIQDRPELADETLEQLGQVFRYALRRSEQEWVTLGEEVDFLTAYLRVEQARFGERLQVELDVDETARQVPVPAMCLQPLVENAVRHGTARHGGAGRVSVRTRRQGDYWRVEVANNGPGFPEDFVIENDRNGHGLKNVQARLSGYYAGEAGVTWERAGEETRVSLRLPWHREHANARTDRG